MKFEWSNIKHLFENSVRITVGVSLVALGIVGLFLPILQGVLLIILGLAMLGLKFVKHWPWLSK